MRPDKDSKVSMMKTGTVAAISTSEEKGVPKQNVGRCRMIKGEGLEGDAHAGTTNRHVSVLCMESIQRCRAAGHEVFSGDFAENLTLEGLVHTDFEIGDVLKVGKKGLLRVSQIGKICHSGCAVFQRVGDCIMPREGIFTEVLEGDMVMEGTPVQLSKAIGVAIVTISDSTSAGDRDDRSGDAISEMLPGIPARLEERVVIPDDEDKIAHRLSELSQRDNLHLVLTTGGTGLGPRDVTPEATRRVLDRELPGVSETMRAYGRQKTDRAMLSRGIAGVANNTLIVNLPGSEKGATESLEAVAAALHHACEMIAGGGHP